MADFELLDKRVMLPQVLVSIEYNGIRFEEGFRADIIVENKVIIELKSMENTCLHIKSSCLPNCGLPICAWAC